MLFAQGQARRIIGRDLFDDLFGAAIGLDPADDCADPLLAQRGAVSQQPVRLKLGCGCGGGRGQAAIVNPQSDEQSGHFGRQIAA